MTCAYSFSVIFHFLRKQCELALLPQRRMLCIKPAYNGLHYRSPHEICLASHPEPLAVNIQRPGFPLI